MNNLPHKLAQTIHVRTRLRERYEMSCRIRDIQGMGFAIRYNLEHTDEKMYRAKIDGSPCLIFKCGRQLKGGAAYLIAWRGFEFVVIYSKETQQLVTAVPFETFRNIKDELLAQAIMSKK